METLGWIVLSGVGMSLIALIGGVTLFFEDSLREKFTLPLVAFAAGTLLGGAFFHMIPEGIEEYGNHITFYLWLVAGFTLFFALEQVLHWHHHTDIETHSKKAPLTYLILIGDAIHNFLGGLAIGGTFLIDIRLGIMSWLAAAAHEIPQELGDFGILIHGGWEKKTALLLNLLSASTFLIGGLTAYFLSRQIEVGFLIPVAAGNFIYIGATDLVPEFKNHYDTKKNILYFFTFVAGIALTFLIKIALEEDLSHF